MPPATYPPLPPPPPPPPPPPQSHTPQPSTPAPLQYAPQPQQQPAPKRPKLASPSPISPHGTYYPASPTPGAASYNTMSAMLPPPPPSHQAPAGGSGGQPPKATDTNELADALASAGIDLKEEEAHLSMPMTTPIPGLNPQEALYIRRDAEMKANHAINPFINIHVLQNRIRAKAKEQNMTLGAQQGMGIASQDTTTFLSLAVKERLHGLITRSVVLARQRRVGNGMISGEWGAFVKGGDKHQTTITNGDGNPTPQNPLKRSFSNYSNPFSHPVLQPKTQTTTSIANETARALRLLAQQELQAETLRLQQKAQKATSSTTGNPENPTSSPAPEGATSSSQLPTPGPGGIDSITSDPPKKLSAKETRKNQDIRVQEAVAHRAANSTAAMMMGLGGAFGGKKKKYAWMMAGTPGGVGSASTAGGAGGGPGRSGVGGMAGDAGQGSMAEAVSVWGKRIGEWREDGEKGLGVQIRDWAGALEGDGRERKAVVRAYMKMK